MYSIVHLGIAYNNGMWFLSESFIKAQLDLNMSWEGPPNGKIQQTPPHKLWDVVLQLIK